MMYRKPLVPDNFKIPSILKTNSFVLKPLTMNDARKDYKAVMQSVGADGKFDFNPNHTLRQNLIDVGWHQKEFQKRSSFTYTVLTLDKKDCIGCVYIYPSDNPSFGAEIYLWVTKEAYGKGLDPILFSAVRRWLKTQWPFKKVRFEGRG